MSIKGLLGFFKKELKCLLDGSTYGFKIPFQWERKYRIHENVISAKQNRRTLTDKITKEVIADQTVQVQIHMEKSYKRNFDSYKIKSSRDTRLPITPSILRSLVGSLQFTWSHNCRSTNLSNVSTCFSFFLASWGK